MGKKLVKPLEDRVVVELLPPEETTEGGIILPQTVQGRPGGKDEDGKAAREVIMGRVVAVGPGRWIDGKWGGPPQVEPGNVVLIGGFAGVKVVIGKQEFRVLRQTDIIAELVEEPGQ